MGVHGLTALLRRYAPNSIRTVSAASLARETVAFDASCHLNKFVYGDEPHEHRHVYGFYLLARFCEHNLITPIFVFDGPHRIAAKKLETERREKARIKIGYSLDYERSRAERLEDWIQLSPAFRELSDTAAARILTQLGETIDELEQEKSLATTKAAAATATLSETEQDEAVAMDTLKGVRDQMMMTRERQLESKLTNIAHELREAVKLANDRAKYTKTVRDLSAQEHSTVASMLRDRIENAERTLDDLKKTNRRMLTSLEKRSIRVTQRLRDECQEFLTTLGFACVTCEGHEAEAMCAHLAQKGISSATVTEDMDTMVFGSAPILRYFFARNRSILRIDPVVAQQELGLSRDEFIDLCILCGTDFSGTIQGIGPIRALQSIRQHRSIENLLANLDSKYTPEPTFDYKLARKVFNSLPPVSADPERYRPSPPDPAKVAEMLKRYDIDEEEVEKRLQSILLQQNAAAFGWGSDPFAATVMPRL